VDTSDNLSVDTSSYTGYVLTTGRTITGTTDSSSLTTGSLICSGGAGIAKYLSAGGINIVSSPTNIANGYLFYSQYNSLTFSTFAINTTECAIGAGTNSAKLYVKTQSGSDPVCRFDSSSVKNSFNFNSVGVGTGTIDTSAAMQIENTTEGILLPRMTATKDSIIMQFLGSLD
jgi:hypothetical protein